MSFTSEVVVPDDYFPDASVIPMPPPRGAAPKMIPLRRTVCCSWLRRDATREVGDAVLGDATVHGARCVSATLTGFASEADLPVRGGHVVALTAPPQFVPNYAWSGLLYWATNEQSHRAHQVSSDSAARCARPTPAASSPPTSSFWRSAAVIRGLAGAPRARIDCRCYSDGRPSDECLEDLQGGFTVDDAIVNVTMILMGLDALTYRVARLLPLAPLVMWLLPAGVAELVGGGDAAVRCGQSIGGAGVTRKISPAQHLPMYYTCCDAAGGEKRTQSDVAVPVSCQAGDVTGNCSAHKVALCPLPGQQAVMWSRMSLLDATLHRSPSLRAATVDVCKTFTLCHEHLAVGGASSQRSASGVSAETCLALFGGQEEEWCSNQHSPLFFSWAAAAYACQLPEGSLTGWLRWLWSCAGGIQGYLSLWVAGLGRHGLLTDEGSGLRDTSASFLYRNQQWHQHAIMALGLLIVFLVLHLVLAELRFRKYYARIDQWEEHGRASRVVEAQQVAARSSDDAHGGRHSTSTHAEESSCCRQVGRQLFESLGSGSMQNPHLPLEAEPKNEAIPAGWQPVVPWHGLLATAPALAPLPSAQYPPNAAAALPCSPLPQLVQPLSGYSSSEECACGSGTSLGQRSPQRTSAAQGADDEWKHTSFSPKATLGDTGRAASLEFQANLHDGTARILTNRPYRSASQPPS